VSEYGEPGYVCARFFPSVSSVRSVSRWAAQQRFFLSLFKTCTPAGVVLCCSSETERPRRVSRYFARSLVLAWLVARLIDHLDGDSDEDIPDLHGIEKSLLSADREISALVDSTTPSPAARRVGDHDHLS